MIKSPLRYPGGKTKAVPAIIKHIPLDITHLMSPFLGGGSVELAIEARGGVEVSGYDINPDLILFWLAALRNPADLAAQVQQYWPLGKARFDLIQRRMRRGETCPTVRAAEYFVLNRASFGGAACYGGYVQNGTRFTPGSIDFLRQFRAPKLSVGVCDFENAITIATQNNAFIYADPPYPDIKATLYDGHADFDHDALARCLRARGDWLLSYNDCPQVRDLYPESDHTILPLALAYEMNKGKPSKEILIFSKDRKPR